MRSAELRIAQARRGGETSIRGKLRALHEEKQQHKQQQQQQQEQQGDAASAATPQGGQGQQQEQVDSAAASAAAAATAATAAAAAATGSGAEEVEAGPNLGEGVLQQGQGPAQDCMSPKEREQQVGAYLCADLQRSEAHQ